MNNENTAPAPSVTYWFDPMCPWAWMTSRWAAEVSEARGFDIEWRIMSLSALNEGNEELPDNYKKLMADGWAPARAVAHIQQHAPELVKPYYDAIGAQIHTKAAQAQQAEGFATNLREAAVAALDSVDFSGNVTKEDVLAAMDDETLDDFLRQSTADTKEIVGDGVGTPVIAIDGRGYFGPVVTPAPTGEQALLMWDALVAMTKVDGFYELKRGRTSGPIFRD